MLGSVLVELVESGRLLASTQHTVVSALKLMLVTNEAFRSRYLARYSAAVGQIINTRAVPIPFKSRLVESILTVFSRSRLSDHESALEARLLNSIVDSLLGILKSRSTARCKVPVLYLFNRIVGEGMFDGRVRIDGCSVRTYAMWLNAHAPSPLRETRLNSCALLRRVSPHVMPVIVGTLQGQYDAVIDTMMRPGRRCARQELSKPCSVTSTYRRECRGVAPESRQSSVSLVSHSKDCQSIRASQDPCVRSILA